MVARSHRPDDAHRRGRRDPAERHRRLRRAPLIGSNAGGINTAQFDWYGLPAISVPCGFSTSGLPIGLQIVGAHWNDVGVLALAHAYERATSWHTRRARV